MADDESISNEKFDAINKKIAELCKDLAAAEEAERKSRIKVVEHNAWLDQFLSSFPVGTHKITNKQAEIFKRYGKEFKCGKRIYACQGPNYRVGFSSVFVQQL